jgi:hypothetical protein
MWKDLREFYSLVGVFEKFLNIKKKQAFNACFCTSYVILKNNSVAGMGVEPMAFGL